VPCYALLQADLIWTWIVWNFGTALKFEIVNCKRLTGAIKREMEAGCPSGRFYLEGLATAAAPVYCQAQFTPLASKGATTGP